MSAPTTAATASPGIASRWIVLAIVCAAQFMVALDTTIVNVALPSIQSDLHMSTQNLAWVINAYVLVFGGFLLLGGRAADLFGRRRLFASGIALFTVASLLCGLATSAGMLFAFRALQGLGAAMLSPAVVSIITTTFTEGPDRAKALAAWSGVSAAATAFGVILGGVLTDALSWPWIFFVNVPVGVVVILLARSFIAESRAPGQDHGLDVPGALLITVGLTALVYAIVEAQGKGWGSTTTIGFGAAAIVLLLVFALVEQRRAMPLVNLAIFRLRTLSTANAAIALIMGANATFFFLMTLYMQEVLHYTAVQTGFAFVPLSVGMMAGSVLAQRLIPRIGIKPQVVLGLALSAAGFLLYLRTPASSASYAVDLMVPMLISSFGLGNALVPATLLATSNVPEKDSGLASGLLNTFFQIGGALGLAILTTLAASRTSNVRAGSADAGTAQAHADALVAGFHLAYGLGAAFFVAAGVLLVTVVRKQDLVTVDDTDALANEMAAAEVVVEAAR